MLMRFRTASKPMLNRGPRFPISPVWWIHIDRGEVPGFVESILLWKAILDGCSYD